MLQLQRIKRPAIHRGGTHPTNEDRRSRSIPTPERKPRPWIKGIRAHLHSTPSHSSAPREGRKKGQLVTGLQLLIRTDQLLVNRNADALERAKI